jgi:alkylation response protein AidB-like acyl-CoA dehydrogenase
VDFRYTEEQLALRETLQRYIARDYDFERRRALARSALGYCERAWAQYADLGLLALPFPEEFGGLGGNAIDVMAVMEMVGQGLLLEPILSTVVLCGSLLADAAAESLKRTLLPQIAAGSCRLALACYEATGRYNLASVACYAQASDEGYRLSGHKHVVLDAPSADCFLVSARLGGGIEDAEGISVFLVKRDAPGLTLSSYPTQCGGRAADLRLDEVAVENHAMIGPVGRALSMIERAVDKGNAALCAEAVGIMTALNDTTLSYLKTRKQFGVPIGSFQVLQHRMADMYIAMEQARSMAIIAATHADSEDAATRRRMISGAKTYISQAARFVGQQSVQLHGAMGVVDEHVVSHYFKRLTMIDLSLGDGDFHLARFSDTLRANDNAAAVGDGQAVLTVA